MPSERQVQVEGRELKLTNLDKVLYPQAGFSKGQVLDYYAKVAPALLPHLGGRALTLRRFPEGVTDTEAAFFEKRCPKHRPSWVKTATVQAGPRAGNIDFCVCENLPTLIWMAQLAALELHPSLSLASAPRIRASSSLTSTPVHPPTCSPAARWRCDCASSSITLSSSCLPKTSGSKGIQVYVPLNSKTTYEQTKPFARAIAQLLEKQTPELVVSKMKKVERKGKVFVDWSQNHRRKTTIAVYSLRARERPTVSTPLRWDEVVSALDQRRASALVFEAAAVLERVERDGDLFAPVLEQSQTLPEL